MSSPGPSRCPGCGLAVGGLELVAAPGGPATAECLAIFGELLAESYEGARRRMVHQLLVDAFVAQHGGGETRREVQAVAVCLMTLQLFVERGVDPVEGPALHKRMADSGFAFERLEPPSAVEGATTVASLLGVADEEYGAVLLGWAAEVWAGWSARHPLVRAWVAETVPVL